LRRRAAPCGTARHGNATQPTTQLLQVAFPRWGNGGAAVSEERPDTGKIWSVMLKYAVFDIKPTYNDYFIQMSNYTQQKFRSGQCREGQTSDLGGRCFSLLPALRTTRPPEYYTVCYKLMTVPIGRYVDLQRFILSNSVNETYML